MFTGTGCMVSTWEPSSLVYISINNYKKLKKYDTTYLLYRNCHIPLASVVLISNSRNSLTYQNVTCKKVFAKTQRNMTNKTKKRDTNCYYTKKITDDLVARASLTSRELHVSY